MTDPFETLRDALADHYALEREIGEGGMATVYLAQDIRLGRPVAIKVFKPDLAASLGHERFLREIKVAAQLQHPNILGVYDSGDAAGLLYYVMPFVAGESLRDRLNREQQLSLPDAIEITREVAAALSHAHSLGIVHRDIKPENILLMGGKALVADFGIARAVDQAGGEKLTKTGMSVGTPVYMSPEQAAGDSHVDGRSDQYSLACVLYELLAGQPPFTGPTAMAIMARHSMEQVPSLRIVRAAIPEDIEQGIFQALEKVPADRFATIAQFADALTGTPTGSYTRRASTRAIPAARSSRGRRLLP
ncbi:MAG: serine/threonine-protein kinase, partial [Gemmatimonadales bacterium]